MSDKINNVYEGLKVIDITNNLAGPQTANFFSNYGAEVIHVERPIYGDDSRNWIPIIDGESLAFPRQNQGKKSLVVDLKDPRGQEIIRKLAETADILVEAYRPGMMDRYGLGYEDIHKINPRLIYCSISAYGHTGPYSQRGGYDIIAQAASGLMDATGEKDGPPTVIGTELGDFVASLLGFGAVNSALYYRERTGEGQHVDISLVKGLAWLAAKLPSRQYASNQYRMVRTGNHSRGLCPYGLFNGNNGEHIVIACPSNSLWQRLCTVMGRPELGKHEDFRTPLQRIINLSGVIEAIEGWLKSFPSIDDAEKIMVENGIPCSKVFSNIDILNDKHYNEAGWIVDVETPDKVTSIDSIPLVGNPFEFSAYEPVYEKSVSLGHDNIEILTGIGYTEEEAEALEKEWAGK